MIITTLGWLSIGIVIGATAGVVWSGIRYTKQIDELESEISSQIAIRKALKEEIFRLDNQPKPKPRSKRRGK